VIGDGGDGSREFCTSLPTFKILIEWHSFVVANGKVKEATGVGLQG
jgi:hypothetical protein